MGVSGNLMRVSSTLICVDNTLKSVSNTSRVLVELHVRAQQLQRESSLLTTYWSKSTLSS